MPRTSETMRNLVMFPSRLTWKDAGFVLRQACMSGHLFLASSLSSFRVEETEILPKTLRLFYLFNLYLGLLSKPNIGVMYSLQAGVLRNYVYFPYEAFLDRNSRLKWRMRKLSIHPQQPQGNRTISLRSA